jgi:PAS domain S-box-containing protein
MTTILVVEDSRPQAQRLCGGLGRAGFDVVHAENGRVALDRLAEGPVDLVLSDIAMPGMDGYELCRQIKDSQPDLPVVLLTALTDPLDVVRGLSAGADSFFRKPHDLEDLATRLRGILYTREMREGARSRMGLELFFLGQRFTVTAERHQLLDLLISTFEDLVTTNEQLRDRERNLAEAHAALAGRLEETERERQRMRAVLTALPVGLVLVDEQGAVDEVNEALLELLGRERDELVSEPGAALSLIVDDRGQALPAGRQPLAQVLAGASEAACGSGFDVFVQRGDGTRAAAMAHAAPIRNADGAVQGAVGMLHGVAGLASHNPLTGLPTHALLVDRVVQAAELSAADDSLSAVLVLTIDRLARVRQAGRAAYDDVVRATASRLKTLVEHEQFALRTRTRSLAYLDDGQFAFVLTGLSREVDAVHLAELLVAHASGTVAADGTDVTVGLSAGAVWGDQEVDAPQLIAAGVQAARAAEGVGGGGVELAATALQEQVSGRLQLESELRHAISAGELTVHYQPQLSLRSGRVSGMEALVRWQHPVRGLVPPDEFIPLAEDSGLIVPLGQYVLREACAQTAAWRRELPDAHNLVVSVNLAAEQLTDFNFTDQVQQILREAGLPPPALVLEITETTAMTDADSVDRRLHELETLGVGLAIDDFGTGYSSLQQLRRFPLNSLKVDRAFVQHMAAEPTARTIVEASVGLGIALGLDVLAEGVETEQQHADLLALGCHTGQGFLWSRPLAPSAFASWWVARQLLTTPGLPSQRRDDPRASAAARQ